jgi:hypothetical protein
VDAAVGQDQGGRAAATRAARPRRRGSRAGRPRAHRPRRLPGAAGTGRRRRNRRSTARRRPPGRRVTGPAAGRGWSCPRSWDPPVRPCMAARSCALASLGLPGAGVPGQEAGGADAAADAVHCAGQREGQHAGEPGLQADGRALQPAADEGLLPRRALQPEEQAFYESAPRASPTSKRSSPSPDDASTRSGPCCGTASAIANPSRLGSLQQPDNSIEIPSVPGTVWSSTSAGRALIMTSGVMKPLRAAGSGHGERAEPGRGAGTRPAPASGRRGPGCIAPGRWPRARSA